MLKWTKLNGFFENWLMKLKFPNLLNHSSSKKSWSFYPYESFSYVHFIMIYILYYMKCTGKILNHEKYVLVNLIGRNFYHKNYWKNVTCIKVCGKDL